MMLEIGRNYITIEDVKILEKEELLVWKEKDCFQVTGNKEEEAG